MATIDYRDNIWFLSAARLGADMGFFSLAAAVSFAANNLQATFKLTNQAIVRRAQERA